MLLLLRCLAVVGLQATLLPQPTVGRHLRQPTPAFDQWTPIYPRHTALRYPHHDDLAAQPTANLPPLARARQLTQFPKSTQFQRDSESEQLPREFSPHAFQFTATNQNQQLTEVRPLSKTPVNVFQGPVSSNDNGSRFPANINPFLNKHVSVVRYPSDFVRVKSTSDSKHFGSERRRNIRTREFGRSPGQRRPETSFEEPTRQSVTVASDDDMRYAKNPLVSDFRRGLGSNEKIIWDEQKEGETEKRIRVLVDSNGITFTSVGGNSFLKHEHTPAAAVLSDVLLSSGGGDYSTGEEETTNNSKENLEAVDDVNTSGQRTHGQTTIIRLKGISLELPPFGGGRTNSSFRLPPPLHPIFETNSPASKRLTVGSPSLSNNFSDKGPVLQSSESQRSVRKIVSTAGSSESKYDKCSRAFHAWMCPQVLVTPQRQNTPNLTTAKSLIQNANFNAPSIQFSPSPTERSTTTENLRKKFGTNHFGEPFNKKTNFPSITSRPTVKTTTERRFGSTMFGEPIYTTTPLPNVSNSSTRSDPTVPSPTTAKKSGAGSILSEAMATIPLSKQYNKCSHPFHSWLCTKNPASTTTAKPRVNNGSPFSDASFDVDVGAVQDATPLPKPQETTHKSYDKCSHAFHSWLCPKQLLPVINRATIPSPSTTQPKAGSGHFPETTSPRSGSINVPKTILSEPPITTTSPPITTRRGSVNFPLPQTLSTTSIRPPLRTTPKVQSTTATAQHKPYDKCSHAFHSWLCQKPIRTRLSSIAVPSRSIINRPVAPPKTTTEKSTTRAPIPTTSPAIRPKTESIPFPEPVNQGKSLFPDSLPPQPSTTTPTPRTKLDICSHPLHAWICLPSTTTSKPGGKSAGPTDSDPANVKKGKQVFPDQQTTIARPSERTAPRSAWDGVDPCSHAFHSWLCKPSHRRLTRPSIVIPAQTKVAEASFPQNSVFLFSDFSSTTLQPTTRPPMTTTPRKRDGILDSNPQTTKSPVNPTTRRTKMGGGIDSVPHQPKKKSDPCDHPFHSYLCTRSTTAVPPVQSKPPPRRGGNVEASPSNTRPNPPQAGRVGFSDPIPPKPTPSSTPKYDKCSHSFHSWLCDVARNIGQESQISSAAIDAYIDSDRFLLKTANLPNIRKLPLDTEGTSQIFFPDSFVNMNQVPVSQLVSSLPDNIQSTNFKVFHSGEGSRSSKHVRATTPSQFEIDFRQKIVPTLPTINSHRTRKFSNEESVTIPSVSFYLKDTSTWVPTVPPHPRVINSPKLTSFDLSDAPTVPPRPAREIDPASFQNIFAKAQSDKEGIITFRSNFNSQNDPSTNVHNNTGRSLPNNLVSGQNKSEPVASVPKIRISFPEAGHRLHPTSPFLQFPSVTSTASLEIEGQKSVPASIIHSHFPDNIPSSTLDLGDNEPLRVIANTRSILNNEKRSKSARRNESNSHIEGLQSNRGSGLKENGKSDMKLDLFTQEDHGIDDGSQINSNNLATLLAADQIQKGTEELSERQTQSDDGLDNQQSLLPHQREKSSHSEQPQRNQNQENHQLIYNKRAQLLQNKQLGHRGQSQQYENVPLLQQPQQPSNEYLQLPNFHQFPIRNQEIGNAHNGGSTHHHKSISLKPDRGEFLPHHRNQGRNYQISGIWGLLESTGHPTPVNQALKFESQWIRNSQISNSEFGRGSSRNAEGYRFGGTHHSNNEASHGRGSYPSSFLVPPPISTSSLQFQRRNDHGRYPQINTRQFSVIPKATNSRQAVLPLQNDSNNLRYPATSPGSSKNTIIDQDEIYRRHWLYLKAVNPVLNYLEPMASNRAAVSRIPLGVLKPGRYK